jgi:hypothetical protein
MVIKEIKMRLGIKRIFGDYLEENGSEIND